MTESVSAVGYLPLGTADTDTERILLNEFGFTRLVAPLPFGLVAFAVCSRSRVDTMGTCGRGSPPNGRVRWCGRT